MSRRKQSGRRAQRRRINQAKKRRTQRNKEHLAGMLDWLLPHDSIFAKMKLHGNTKWLPKCLVCLAILWAWSESKHLTVRHRRFRRRGDLGVQRAAGHLAGIATTFVEDGVQSHSTADGPRHVARPRARDERTGGSHLRDLGGSPTSVELGTTGLRLRTHPVPVPRRSWIGGCRRCLVSARNRNRPRNSPAENEYEHRSAEHEHEATVQPPGLPLHASKRPRGRRGRHAPAKACRIATGRLSAKTGNGARALSLRTSLIPGGSGCTAIHGRYSAVGGLAPPFTAGQRSLNESSPSASPCDRRLRRRSQGLADGPRSARFGYGPTRAEARA